MAAGTSLAERIRQRLRRRPGITEKRMFGTGFLLNGNLCLGVWNGSLVVRLGPGRAEEALGEPHVSEFHVRGRPMKGWVLVAPEGLGDDRLGHWIQRALQFTRTLPAKEK